ncbi:MAG: hypothetical protein GXO60_07410 [Epsilonproteobacteria bacterium]|nr:hypothetical protein [Campylobacterota bacterium]
MKRFTLLLALLMFFSSLLFALTDKELAISINLSGKQRMLTQKMTKEAFLVRSNINKENNIKNLKNSSQLFDKTLKGLIAGDKSLNLVAIKNDEIQEQLQKVDTLWQPFYKEVQNILSGKADDSSYKFLEENNIVLLKEMNKAVGMYAQENKGSSKLKLANDINLAGKQRMLTQKMGKDLLFVSNKFKTKQYLSDFKKSRELFDRTLNGLFNGDKELNLVGTNLPKITNQLNVVKKLWSEEQPILDKAIKGKDIQKAINGLDNILVEMNRAVTEYTKSVNRQKQRLKFASIINSFMNKNNTLKRLVNLSGKQRMLTQRMTKLSLLVSSGIDKENNIEKLKKFSSLYDRTLKAFKNGDKELECTPIKNPVIDEQIEVIEKKWKPFYQHIQNIIDDKDKDKKSLKYVVDNNEELLKVSNELVKRYEKSNKSQNYLDKARLHIVNVAGRQRMLTQKMTKEKLLIISGQKEYKEKIKKTIELFDSSLNALINGDANQMIVKPTNKKIKEQLAKVEEIWKKLKPLYSKSKNSTRDLAIIITQNPILLSEMNKMVKMAEVEIEY